jgi:predicted fused transcriptional regulator/phosphomethylpyrimidine kinase
MILIVKNEESSMKDAILEKLEKAIKKALSIEKISDFIPEVGMNIVYSKPQPSSTDNVAGLSGRIIKAMGEPLSCGEIVYGGSKYLASVVIEAIRIDPSKRAALNIRGGNDIILKLESIGLNVTVLPSKVEGGTCPVTVHLEKSNILVDAYFHPGDFGVESTTTIIGDDPLQLVDLLEKLVELE